MPRRNPTNGAAAKRISKEAVARNRDIWKIEKAIGLEIIGTARCFVCGTVTLSGDPTLPFATYLLDQGWAYTTSEKFETTGLMCPGCHQQTDAERGDD